MVTFAFVFSALLGIGISMAIVFAYEGLKETNQSAQRARQRESDRDTPDVADPTKVNAGHDVSGGSDAGGD